MMWKLTTTAALAACMIAGPALAQQTTGNPAMGNDKSKAEQPKDDAMKSSDTMKSKDAMKSKDTMKSDMKSDAMKSSDTSDMKSSDMKSGDMKSTDMHADKKMGRKGGMAMADEKVKAAQQALKDKGHDPGSIDGKMGPKTQAAIRDFQKAQGMEATGHLDAKTMQSLGMDGEKTGMSGSATGGSASPATTPTEKTK